MVVPYTKVECADMRDTVDEVEAVRAGLAAEVVAGADVDAIVVVMLAT